MPAGVSVQTFVDAFVRADFHFIHSNFDFCCLDVRLFEGLVDNQLNPARGPVGVRTCPDVSALLNLLV